MKKIVVLFSFGFALVSCNSDNNNNTSKQTDTSQHSNHNTTNNTGGSNYVKDMHDAMSNSMQQMKTMQATGDADFDFAMMMKHHHQGAIDMSRVELAGGKDDSVKKIAQKIIDEQQKEIDQFDILLKQIKPAGNSDYGQRAMGMMQEMSQIQMETSSLDAMFVSMMIPHHEDAIKMSEEYLKVGKNAAIKKLAQNIISSNKKEKEEMQQWLNAKKTGGTLSYFTENILMKNRLF